MEQQRARKIALIPAYEPDLLLLRLLESLREASFTCVVVDDGSGPAYADIFASAGACAEVISCAENRGKGSALKTGLQYIKEHYAEEHSGGGCVVVTLDADGQHTPADAQRVCDAALGAPDALVLGSREFKGGVPLRSRFGNIVTRWVYAASTGVRVRDTQTGLRAFSDRLLPMMLAIPGDRYEYEMNVLLACARQAVPIKEVTIETVYYDNNRGSHFSTVRDSCRIYREILRFSAASFVSFLVDYGLYSLLSAATAGLGARGLLVSNVGARVVSASVNYALNRRFVFNSREGVARTLGGYALLAAAVLAGNTLVLGLLVQTLGLGRYLAKLLTELLFFALSWAVQRKLIFKNREKQKEPARDGEDAGAARP
ncbi:MAG: bifunctional glycosyltransferase family 2/GtrA family protein [Oscillospiraceae bacterium]|nr:bifunctional glycosyltransferase family 2/GtrA family protein [Oscillospiraceae bacterium]